jgi:hypothetical protein
VSASILSLPDEEELERLILAYTPKFQRVLEAAPEQLRETGGVRRDEFWQDMEAEEP